MKIFLICLLFLNLLCFLLFALDITLALTLLQVAVLYFGWPYLPAPF